LIHEVFVPCDGAGDGGDDGEEPHAASSAAASTTRARRFRIYSSLPAIVITTLPIFCCDST